LPRAILGGAAVALALTLSAQNQTPAGKALLNRGIELISSQPAEAVKLLEQALRLDPELPGLRLDLGIAYHAIGDEADAEAELREAVDHAPTSADAHNYLGIVLFQRGDPRAARDQFAAAARLAPKDPNAHFNLGEALARTGDPDSAVEELRIAAGLAPGDAVLARLVKVVETGLRAPGTTIKVDVRQVLVPVVVQDQQGHHITGLTQADFKVFEDGVEQKITAFGVESSGLPPQAVRAIGEPLPSPAAPQAAPSAPKPHRTYMIVIDTLHTSASHLASVREALQKLFAREHSADSQYVMIALGASAQMLINVTSDPSAVLAVLSNKRLQKILLDGQLGGLGAEMDRFRRDLTETRAACDLAPADNVSKVQCAAGLGRTTEQSRQIAEMDATVTVGFLRQLGSMVAQLAPARDRRTILLISDGLAIAPGREAMALVNAYFPAASHCMVPSDVYCPPNQMISASRMAEEFEPILKLAAASNVTIDTIDSRGLYGQRAFDASNPGTSAAVAGAVGRVERDAAAAAGNTLMEIAAATGGTAFRNSNDLLGGLERAIGDGRDYYMISYIPSNTNFDGTFRAITVRVRDAKALVSAKRGYWAAQ
jgi:VWFA-related protein